METIDAKEEGLELGDLVSEDYALVEYCRDHADQVKAMLDMKEEKG